MKIFLNSLNIKQAQNINIYLNQTQHIQIKNISLLTHIVNKHPTWQTIISTNIHRTSKQNTRNRYKLSTKLALSTREALQVDTGKRLYTRQSTNFGHTHTPWTPLRPLVSWGIMRVRRNVPALNPLRINRHPGCRKRWVELKFVSG